MKENKRKAVRLILLLVFLISAGILFYDMVLVPRQNQELSEQLKKDFQEETPGDTPGDTSPEEERPSAGEKSQVSPLDLAALQAAYPDVQGWLTIPGTNIDYPVLQSTESEPEFYLKRNYKKEWSANGSLFLQWNSNVSESQNLIIYGHNMNSGAMFGNLDQYRQYSYWEAHKSVFFQTISGVSEYEIVAVMTADTGIFPFQQVVFGMEGVDSYVERAKALSVFKTGGSQNVSDHVLTLVTCAYEWDGARIVVVAVEKD
ncbi:class B sortase [Hespellia stercorisuis]|uniref:Sortase B n=1 Tax=Hespellia stercorisuis DSM 15480 TaxID=1121950 RepID=A0A1M6TAX0_9FIRM|nr:class B sortase [Hespellia stercorisuis]SHK54135.1 sortase B [Hespellia stercorisuis DSM 15480]